jgi:hypothetical protein
MALKREEQAKYKFYYDIRHNEVSFEIGDKVLVLFDAPAKGFLIPRWEGPFAIIEKLNSVTYRVESERRIFAVHVQRMIRFYERKELSSQHK